MLCDMPLQALRRELSGGLKGARLQPLRNISIAAIQEAPEMAPYAVVCVTRVCSDTRPATTS